MKVGLCKGLRRERVRVRGDSRHLGAFLGIIALLRIGIAGKKDGLSKNPLTPALSPGRGSRSSATAGVTQRSPVGEGRLDAARFRGWSPTGEKVLATWRQDYVFINYGPVACANLSSPVPERQTAQPSTFWAALSGFTPAAGYSESPTRPFSSWWRSAKPSSLN